MGDGPVTQIVSVLQTREELRPRVTPDTEVCFFLALTLSLSLPPAHPSLVWSVSLTGPPLFFPVRPGSTDKQM